MKARYSIVRVDGECPKGFNEDIYCKWCGNCGKLYGDTKEQMVRKIAQVIYKQEVKLWATSFLMQIEEVSEYVREGIYDKSLTLAKEIVEFLGVEE